MLLINDKISEGDSACFILTIWIITRTNSSLQEWSGDVDPSLLPSKNTRAFLYRWRTHMLEIETSSSKPLLLFTWEMRLVRCPRGNLIFPNYFLSSSYWRHITFSDAITANSLYFLLSSAVPEGRAPFFRSSIATVKYIALVGDLISMCANQQ